MATTRTVLSRRTLLRGVLATGAAVAIPLPRLGAMLNDSGTAYAQGTPLARSYVTWFFGNGVLPPRWVPAATGSGSQWSLSDQLAPLSEQKSYLTVISGLRHRLPNGMPHPTGSAAATTGAPVKNASAQAASIDQIVANVIGKDTDFRSLEVGVSPATPNGPENTLHAVSHRGPNAPNAPEFDPKVVFARLFTSGGSSDDQAAKLARVRGSVLDAVLADGNSLAQSLGAQDKQRLDQHLEAIRSLERRLTSTTTSTCTKPDAPTAGKDTRSEAPAAVNTAMAELVALALACEKTRAVTYVFTLPAAHVYYRHLASDMNDDFHDTICHSDAGDASNQPRVHTGVIYAMRCLNEFLQRLKTTPHGGGNLLESSLVYVTSDTAWGKTHTTDEWPVLLAGRAGGAIRGDAHLRFPDQDLSRVLLTVANTFGANRTELGLEQGRVTEELPGVHA